MKELTHEQEILITEANKEKRIQKEIEGEEILKECYDWWRNLNEEEQSKIMTDFYPTEVKEDTDIDKMFGDMPGDSQLWIYHRTIRKSKIKGKIPINHERFEWIQKKVGRRKLDNDETYRSLLDKDKW